MTSPLFELAAEAPAEHITFRFKSFPPTGRVVFLCLIVLAVIGGAALMVGNGLFKGTNSTVTYATVAVFLLAVGYVSFELLSGAFSRAEYALVLEGGRLSVQRIRGKSSTVEFSAQAAAVLSLGFEFGRAKGLRPREARKSPVVRLRERGLYVHYSVMGRMRRHLVRMRGLSRARAEQLTDELRETFAPAAASIHISDVRDAADAAD